jgi:Tol biopolymer transport system component/Ca2+-binding EF-hand superfamily protein
MTRVVLRSCEIVVLLWFTAATVFAQAQPVASKPDKELYPVSWKAFDGRDKNKDGQLSDVEFVKVHPEANQPLHQRDFKLLDLNRDGQLSFSEFRNLPGTVPFAERGRMPDPIVKLVDEQMKKFEAGLKDWDANKNGKLEAVELSDSQFFETFDDQFLISRGVQWFLTKPTRAHWLDRDNDGALNKDEVRMALDVSFGIRSWEGTLIHKETGMIAQAAQYRWMDINRDSRISKDEHKQRGYDRDLTETRFKQIDSNNDGQFSFEEWTASEFKLVDPLRYFRDRDPNFDGRIDREELAKFTPAWQAPVGAHIFPGFDLDRDGGLSWEEFAATPLVNQVYQWHTAFKETDGNGKLSPEEFVYEAQERHPLMAGLLAEYFRRYDVNKDGALDHDEFEFTTPEAPKSRIYRMNVDGSDLELLADIGFVGSNSMGSPDLSTDGKILAFDATPAVGVENAFHLSHIITMPLEGPNKGQMTDLGFGNCPDWSHDGQRLTFFTNAGNPAKDPHGSWVANADGSNRKLIAPNMWNPRFSPDDKLILCADRFRGAKQLFLYDVETKDVQQVLATRTVLGVPEFEPNGVRIALTVLEDGQRKLCLIDLTKPAQEPVELFQLGPITDTLTTFTDSSRPQWSADGKELIFTARTEKAGIHRIMIDSKDPPFSFGPPTMPTDACGVPTPDHKKIIFTSSRPLKEFPNVKKFVE